MLEEEKDEAPDPTASQERKHIENLILRDTWKSSCCGGEKTVSRACLQFSFQAGITIAILIFCFYQLGSRADPENTAVYFSLISSLISLYISPPTLGTPLQDGQKERL